MALALSKAAPLKPEIRLLQALSEFEAILSDDQKKKLRGQSPPDSTDVMRFTAEIDRDAGQNRKSRQCMGTRLTNVLHAVQQFSTIVDFIVGSSNAQIAGAIWGTVRICLQLVSAISSYFDRLSTLFMRIGSTCPRYRDFGLLYPESKRLRSALCEYFVVIVRLCRQAVLFLKKPFWTQLSSSILRPFESEFGGFRQDLERLGKDIQEEVSLASNQAQQNEAKEKSRYRAFKKNLSNTSGREIGEARARKRKNTELSLFLSACSVYNHEKSWKQARKAGNTNWIFHDERYKQWKNERSSTALWCTGILGSGKTVLSANVIEDLKIATPATPAVVAYFFCRFDEAKSLETRTIIGSIARQIFDHMKSDIVDAITEMIPDTVDTDQIMDYLQQLLPSKSQRYIIVIDGLDECKEKERKLLLLCLKQLLGSKHIFQLYCSSRPDVSRWAHTLIQPQWNISMSQKNPDIEEYVKYSLEEHLESGNLSLGDSTIILTIQDALLKKANGMFLWVAFQIVSICSQKTDEAILAALEDLPKDLPDTFNRILRKLQHSNAADFRFCRKIFDLVAAAQRALTIEELREAVSVEPGSTSWDSSKLVNDMLRLLSDSCGSLIAIDEEHLTVHFTHHSVKQHLLSEPVDSDMSDYHINTEKADLYLGDVIVTYLNFGIFDRQLARVKSPMLPQVKSNSPALLGGSLSGSKIGNRLAVRLLKSMETSSLDIHSQLETAAGMAQTQPTHPFLPYAQEYWLFHTKLFKPSGVAGYTLWQRLIGEEVKTIDLLVPWAPEKWFYLGKKSMKWIMQNKHWALIDLTLVWLSNEALVPKNERFILNIGLLLEFLKRIETDLKNVNLDIVLYLASYLDKRAVVSLSLEKGANVNFMGGYYGTALQAASLQGHEAIVRLLLENGANVNSVGGFYGTALQAASLQCHGTTLLEKRVDVHLGDGAYVPGMLGGFRSQEAIVRLLLENGATVEDRVMKTASILGNKKVKKLLRNAMKSQSSGLGPPPS